MSAAIGLHPNDAESHLERGRAFLKLGEYRKARDDSARAIEIDPKMKERVESGK